MYVILTFLLFLLLDGKSKKKMPGEIDILSSALLPTDDNLFTQSSMSDESFQLAVNTTSIHATTIYILRQRPQQLPAR